MSDAHLQLVLFVAGAVCVVVSLILLGLMFFRKRFLRPDLRLPATEGEDWRDGIPENWRVPPDLGGPDEPSFRHVYIESKAQRNPAPVRYPMLVEVEDHATRTRLERLKRGLRSKEKADDLAGRFK